MSATIALLPGLAAAWVAFRKSPQAALLAVYVPALLLLPDYYYWDAPGLPDPSFVEAAILPVAVAFFLRGVRSWRFSFADILVVAFAAAVGGSEYLNAGFKEAQNLMFDCVTGVCLPYLLAKGLVEPHRLRAPLARRMVLLFFVLACVSLFEFRFAQNPYRMFLDSFFPAQGRGWVVTVRWGFGRVAGPYGHAILAGIMLMVGFRLARWAQWSKLWPARPKRLGWLPLSTGALLSLGILGGLLMTLCRGPWIGGVAAALLAALGRVRNRGRAVGISIALGVCVGIPAFVGFRSYVAVGRDGAASATQETAAYRFELLQNYLDIVGRKPLLGWGRNTWPKVPGQPSIDNHYLLLLLMHGWLATLFLFALLVHIGGRLFRHGMREPRGGPPGGSFALTLCGCLVGIYVAVATVFMGLNTQPLLFLLFGWGEGYLLFGTAQRAGGAVVRQSVAPMFRFRRVLA